MVRSSEPSMIVRRWLSIFSRADWSMRASCISSASIILRTSRRTVLRSSMNSTSSMSATASVTTWASLFTLSRLSRTAEASLKNGFVLLGQFGFHFAKHFLVVRARFLHFVGVGFENDADFIVDAVFQRQFVKQCGVHFLIERRHSLGLDETARNQFLVDFAGGITHIFLAAPHVRVRNTSVAHASI